ncbi:MAG: ImmA/IrrE family metallo-endopeptidase [Methanobrevibacter sp.]|jgi:Zn-dependent peptidase ImmA (M78 family)|nr:ImmA/IrrE family metallo-endopeptidase [Candidatus Methanoflexus mossambicus]
MKQYYDTNQLAENLRREWGIDNYSPIDIFSLTIEKMPNLTLVLLPLDEKISGCCSKIGIDQVIFINSEHSKGRQNFTLAHEIYHLIYEDNNEWLICSGYETNINSEKEADNFASSLLLPSCALNDYMRKNNIKKWNLKDIIFCEQFFQISHVAMLYKLKTEKLISQRDFEDYKYNIKREAIKLGFSTELYDPAPENKKYFSFGNYIRLTEKAFDDKKISIGKKEELLMDIFRSDIVYGFKEGDFIEK